MEKVRIADLSDIERIEEVPLEDRIKAYNTYDLIKHGCLINQQAIALSFILSGEHYDSPIQVTYGEFLGRMHQTANLFHDIGVGPKDVISFLLPNLPHTYYILWGGESAGIVNPINPLLEPSSIADICQAVGTKVLVALGEFPGSDIWEKVDSIRGDLPDLKAIIKVMGQGSEKDGIYGFDEVIGNYDSTRLDSGRVFDPHDTASIYHTGGTTGTPKLAPRTHYNESSMASILDTLTDFNTGETMLCGLPLFHANATTLNGSFPFSVGAHTVMLSPRGYRDVSILKNFYKIIEHYKAVAFGAVPTVLSVLLDIPIGDVDISSLRYAVCGSAPLPVELFNRFEAHCGITILEGYGLTEGTCISSANPYYGQSKVGSVGLRLPYTDMKAFVMDPDGKIVREADIDEIGAICIKGPNVFSGYLQEVYNRDVWPGNGWFNTGDLGRKDDDGYFWLTGREKELIIRGGSNIDPAVIEEPLYRLAGVQAAAAVGRPDPHAGEVPIAYVQLQKGSHLQPEDILVYLRQEIGEKAAIPKEIILLDEIPLTAVGKIFKPALRRDAIRRVYLSELDTIKDITHSLKIEVKQDNVHGDLVTLKIKAAPHVEGKEILEKVKGALSRFTVRYQLEIL
ncbi:MAG: acyl-CoA synthetase [Deltaproteobacteria bacterium]|nr:acyl-CoA synthetase [Deltaproteobacteria bacterium]